MTGKELYNLLISFMDGEIISKPFAYQLLNMAKDEIEMERPWMKLKSFQDDYSFLSSDSISNFKDLPDRFLMTYGDTPLKLINGGDILKFKEQPMEKRDENEDDMLRFYIHHNENTFAIMGGLSQGYTGSLYFIKRTEDIEEGTTWIFPKFSHPMLVFKALILHRGEVDFDDINARMMRNDYGTFDQMKQTLNMWDAQLGVSARRGSRKKDLFNNN